MEVCEGQNSPDKRNVINCTTSPNYPCFFHSIDENLHENLHENLIIGVPETALSSFAPDLHIVSCTCSILTVILMDPKEAKNC